MKSGRKKTLPWGLATLGLVKLSHSIYSVTSSTPEPDPNRMNGLLISAGICLIATFFTAAKTSESAKKLFKHGNGDYLGKYKEPDYPNIPKF